MSNEELKTICAHVAATAETFGQQLSPQATLMMANDLQSFGLQAVINALARVRREATRLTLREVLDKLSQAGGWLSSDEAWAVAIEAQDERATVVWTLEAAKAFQEAKPLLDMGDKIGARMAFKAAYERCVSQAMSDGKQPKSIPSFGHDSYAREAALSKAIQQGRISQDAALPYQQNNAIGWNATKLLTSECEPPSDAPADVIARLKAMKASMKPRDKEAERLAREELQRKKEQDRKDYWARITAEKLKQQKDGNEELE